MGLQIRVPKLKAQLPYSPAVPDSDNWLQIIGVVADARDDGLRKAIKPGIYVPYTVSMRMFTQILVRARGEPLALLQAIRREVRSIDADQQVIGDPQDLEHWIIRQPEWAGERLVTVVRRTNEFGIRMALGAPSGEVLRLVFASAAASVGAGLIAGVILSIILARVLATWTQETSRNPLILIAVMLVLSAAAGTACVFPARRASAIDPMAALRYE